MWVHGVVVYIVGTVRNSLFCDGCASKDGCNLRYISDSACTVKTAGALLYLLLCGMYYTAAVLLICLS